MPDRRDPAPPVPPAAPPVPVPSVPAPAVPAPAVPAPAVPAPGTWLVITTITVAILAVSVIRTSRVVAPLTGDGQTFPWPDMRLDLNTAGAAEINTLPGVGPRLAERIVAERQTGGPFGSVDDVVRVSGIGPGIVERIRPFVVAEKSSNSEGPGTEER